jgi:hypothetical protein
MLFLPFSALKLLDCTLMPLKNHMIDTFSSILLEASYGNSGILKSFVDIIFEISFYMILTKVIKKNLDKDRNTW